MAVRLTVTALLLGAALATAGMGLPHPAAAADLHRLFEDRCAACHGDAGPFAQEFLADRGLTAERLGRFVLRHGGGVPPDQAPALAAMLLAQAETPPLFQQHCRICHGKAADFTRDRLILRDGVLVNRYSGRPVAPFLRTHAELSSTDQTFFLDLLTRIEGEVHGP